VTTKTELGQNTRNSKGDSKKKKEKQGLYLVTCTDISSYQNWVSL